MQSGKRQTTGAPGVRTGHFATKQFCCDSGFMNTHMDSQKARPSAGLLHMDVGRG